MSSYYYERMICLECCAVHWLEVSRNGKTTCHGIDYTPRAGAGQTLRRSGRGYEIKDNNHALPLDWQIAQDYADKRR